MNNKLALVNHLAGLYKSGGNIIKHLKSLDGRTANTTEDILISYDFQAGSYIKAYRENPDYLQSYTSHLTDVLMGLGSFGTILEAGCGEATTLAVLGQKLPPHTGLAGFDLSWSRVRLGRQFASDNGLTPTLFSADLFNIPLADKSVDVVYTSHSIEPNGGRETEAIAELARVARKWLVLLEPAYDLAPLEARLRMEEHGYVQNLASVISGIGLHLQEHRLFPVCVNPLNPTGLYLVRLNDLDGVRNEFQFQCPVSRMPMVPCKGAYYSRESLLAYPVLDGIPCLLEGNAILATKFEE